MHLYFQFWIGGVIALGEYLYTNNEEVIFLYRLVFTSSGVIVRVIITIQLKSYQGVGNRIPILLVTCDLLKTTLSKGEAVAEEYSNRKALFWPCDWLVLS